MSGSIFHPFVLDNAAGQETVVGIGSDSEKYGVGISSHVHITGIGTFSDLLHTTGIIHAVGGIKDTSGNIGSSGKVLSSTGSGLQWIDPSEGSTANAVNVGTNLNSTNADQFVAFMGASSGNNPVRVDAGIKYNPSSNLLTVGSITGSIAASNVNSGTLGVDRIPSLPASKITSGQLDAARIPTLNQNTTGNAATATSATTAATVTTAAQTNITSLGTLTGLTVNGNIIQSGTSNYIRINGALQDKDGQDGDSGQVLSSTGNQINWINVGDISAGSASQVAVSDESSDTTCFPLFVNAATGNQSPKSGTNLTFNSSTGALSATSFSGSIAASNINSGTLGTDRIPSLAASKITSGTLGTDRIPNLAASKITSGTLGTARIPNLAASKITSGTLGTDRIPSLAASKITSGQFDTARIPTLNQNTTGTSGGLSGSPSITVTNITIDGQLRDGDNAFGSSGQVLSSDGTDTKWINAGSLSAGAAAQVAVNATNTTNSSHFIAFTETSSGNEEIRVDNSLTYNPSTNVLTAATFSGALSGNAGSATILANTRTIGGVSFNGSANINLPGVNQAGNQNTSGNAATATKAYVTESNTDTTNRGLVFCDAANNASGNKDLKYDRNLTYNANSNTLVANIFQGNTVNVGEIILGGSNGSSGQYVRSTGSGAEWANFPTIPTNNNQLTNGAGYITSSGTADKAETARIVTDSSSALRPLLFIASSGSDNSAVNNTFASLKFSPTIFSLSYNPSTEILYVNKAQLNKIQVSSGGVGNAGQVLTSGGSGSNMTWTYPVPSGGIIIWSGAANAIPSGWVLCDGNNSTPDLRDRFVVGAGSGYSVGNTGGAASVTLTTNQIPSHTHSYSSANHPTSSGPEQNQSGGPEDRTTFNVSKTTGSTGGGQSHENRPPYYALCYIMKT